MLWVTRYPWKTSTDSSSIRVGIETASAFLHWPRTLTRSAEMPKTSATSWSWRCASSNGFSRRCEGGASTVVTLGPLFRWKSRVSICPRRLLPDPEVDHFPARGPGNRRVRAHDEVIAAVTEDLTRGGSAGELEVESAGQLVPELGQQAEPLAFLRPERDLESSDRLELGPGALPDHPPGEDGQHRRRLGRVEGGRGEGNAAEQSAQGTRTGMPLEGVIVIAPSRARGIRPAVLTTTFTPAFPFARSTSRLGEKVSENTSPPTAPSSLIRSGRLDTLWRTIVRTTRRGFDPTGGSASVEGRTETSPPAAAPRLTRPAPCASSESPASGRAVPVRSPIRSDAESDGRACASRAAAPAIPAAATLVPLTVPNRPVPSSFVPGSAVGIVTPGPARSGFTRPS